MNDCIDKPACFDRREFLVKTGLLAGGAILTISALGGSSFAAALEDLTIELTADSPLSKPGGSQVVDSSAGKIIVINDGGKFLAFSAVCTHKRGIVDYDPATKKLVCPKHGSTFDGTNGAVVKGPADDPLKSYGAAKTGSKVTVSVS